MATDVRTEITDRVAVLTLSNPERRNAMNIELSRSSPTPCAARPPTTASARS